MENLSIPEPKELSGRRVLRLTTILNEGIDQRPDNLISVHDARKEYILDRGLSPDDVLIIDGKDALSLLPRPEAYGNRCLALMEFLDSSPTDILLKIDIDEEVTDTAAD